MKRKKENKVYIEKEAHVLMNSNTEAFPDGTKVIEILRQNGFLIHQAQVSGVGEPYRRTDVEGDLRIGERRIHFQDMEEFQKVMESFKI